MANKNRVLFLLNLLRQQTDENHPMTTAELRQILSDNGFHSTVPTLRDDIQTLIDAGFDVSVTSGIGVTTAYCFVDREWTEPELQILIDAVSSSQFLTAEKSRELIQRLAKLAGPSAVERLKPSILVSEHVKAENNLIFINVQAIREGIETRKKVQFQYFNYNLRKKKEFRHHGEVYTLSPYATIWMNDRYYLVGWSDKREKVVSFRLDRMDLVKVTEMDSVPEPEDFNLQDYNDKIFKMYDGEEVEVTLRCRNELIDQVIDKFGTKIVLQHKTRTTFDLTVPVSLSGTFFSWVFQYAGQMTVVKPEKAVNWYIHMLEEAMDDVLGTD